MASATYTQQYGLSNGADQAKGDSFLLRTWLRFGMLFAYR